MTFRPFPTTAVAAAAAVLLGGCSQDQDTVAESPVTSADEPTQEAAWSYEGDTGPEDWAELDPEYATCSAGQEQSPIDLPAGVTEPADEAEVTYDYEPASYELVNTGHTLLATAGAAGGLTIDGERYELLQFHAHGPSEHAIGGEREELEIHLVHQNDEGELAVVGVLVDEGPADSTLADAWAELPEEGGTAALDDFDAASLLPEDRTTFRYSGSLTTPPCTEGVRWLVMEETVTAPADVVSAFESAVGDSARPLQPLNEREPVLGG